MEWAAAHGCANRRSARGSHESTTQLEAVYDETCLRLPTVSAVDSKVAIQGENDAFWIEFRCVWPRRSARVANGWPSSAWGEAPGAARMPNTKRRCGEAAPGSISATPQPYVGTQRLVAPAEVPNEFTARGLQDLHAVATWTSIESLDVGIASTDPLGRLVRVVVFSWCDIATVTPWSHCCSALHLWQLCSLRTPE
jgi:hypothetical protein